MIATPFGGRYKAASLAASLIHSVQTCGAGASRDCSGRDASKGAAEMWVFGSALNYLAMIAIDDSQLEEDYREFLTRWAEALQVPLGVLVLRIVEAAIDGDQYIAGRPHDD
jgi:hypothetical protein